MLRHQVRRMRSFMQNGQVLGSSARRARVSSCPSGLHGVMLDGPDGGSGLRFPRSLMVVGAGWARSVPALALSCPLNNAQLMD